MNTWIFTLILAAFTVVSTGGVDAAPKAEKPKGPKNEASAPKSNRPLPNSKATPSKENPPPPEKEDWEPAPAPMPDDE